MHFQGLSNLFQHCSVSVRAANSIREELQNVSMAGAQAKGSNAGHELVPADQALPCSNAPCAEEGGRSLRLQIQPSTDLPDQADASCIPKCGRKSSS